MVARWICSVHSSEFCSVLSFSFNFYLSLKILENTWRRETKIKWEPCFAWDLFVCSGS